MAVKVGASIPQTHGAFRASCVSCSCLRQ